MPLLSRIAAIPGLLLLACASAAMFGALQNQLSYTVSPEYFHGFKFNQFKISEPFHSRLGAAWVGVQASWWMGLFIGVPVAVCGLGLPNLQIYVRRFCHAIILVLIITAICAVSALIFGYRYFSADLLPQSVAARELQDPLAFAWAGIQHEGAYAGGALGLFVAMIMMIYWTFKARKPQKA